jgi:uncharacterized repeat protein (TIGR02543 family)/flagellin-like protein
LSKINKKGKIRRNRKAVSPVLAVLMMVAVAIAASLVAYAWVMNYLSFTTSKTGKAVQIQSVGFIGTDLMIYVQNVGQGAVQLDPAQSVYINGILKNLPTGAIDDTSLDEGETATITVADQGSLAGQRTTIRIVALEGTFTELSLTTSIEGQVQYSLIMYVVGSGSVNPGNSTHAQGTVVNLEAMHAIGWSFTNWGGGASGTTNTTITMDGPKTVTATFTQNVYTLTVTLVGSGIINLNDSGPYNYGDWVELTAVPDAGWTFSAWSGDLTGSNNPEDILIDGNKAVTATFTQDEYALTINVVGSGSVSKNPNQATYHYGDSVQLTANTASGWTFSGWSGAISGSQNPKTIIINGTHTITATFTQPVTVTLLSDGFEGKWTTDSDWQRQTDQKHAGTYSMRLDDYDDGALSSDNINALGATSITVNFWYMNDDTETNDLSLYYYNGASWVFIFDLGNNNPEDTWLQYTQTITDSQYFKSDFKIRFTSPGLEEYENIWIDDIQVTVTGTGMTFSDDFEAAQPAWNANWSGNWYESGTVHSGYSSAGSQDYWNEGSFTCNNLDASDATSITVDFWYRLDDTEDNDLILSFYDGTTYSSLVNLGGGTEDTWLHYNTIITGSQYFISNFRIRFTSNLDSSENVWIDDVLITKLTP